MRHPSLHDENALLLGQDATPARVGDYAMFDNQIDIYTARIEKPWCSRMSAMFNYAKAADQRAGRRTL